MGEAGRGPSRAAGGRLSGERGAQDSEHPILVLQHIVIGEAQDGVALVAEELIAQSVGFQAMPVGFAIDLDHQTRRMAGKVDVVGADLLLSAEMMSRRTKGVQQTPHAALGPGGVGTELFLAAGAHGVMEPQQTAPSHPPP
ncbi:MAG: hypothetical protein BGO83_27140 [Devosia sp. 66-14]|nr:MAG: hypothetical protein ABS47_17645 [Devosia sp. SCN 66-27]OJX27444.1 MAG: hypothetical protein BGO83_27140 [Devosia sp. 66-14]